MKGGLEVEWWEWLLLVVLVESLIPTKRGLK